MEYVLNVVGFRRLNLKGALVPFAVFGAHVYDHFIPHARNNYHPHLLGHRALALFSGLLVAVKIFTLALISFGPILPAFSSAITPTNIITLTNQSRQEFGLPGLTENAGLDQAAQSKANDMLAKGYFSHNTPDGRTPWSFITAAGYNYLMAGENLAVNFTEAENVETAWMNSPGHKANILNKNFQEIGIGISQGAYQDHTAIFVVQMFGLPAEQQISLSDKPTTVQTAAVPPPASLPVKAKVMSVSPASATKVPTSPQPALNKPPKTLADNQQPQPQPLPPLAVSVEQGNVTLDGQNVVITAEVSGPAAKVLAYFGQQAVMLLPKSETLWSGQASLNALAQTNAIVRLAAFGMQGQSGQLVLADFAPSTIENYNLSASPPVSRVSWLGRSFDPKDAESRFYLVFIAAMLSCLVLAVGLKRHVQHLSLIANSSFVIIFAVMLWWGG